MINTGIFNYKFHRDYEWHMKLIIIFVIFVFKKIFNKSVWITYKKTKVKMTLKIKKKNKIKEKMQERIKKERKEKRTKAKK